MLLMARKYSIFVENWLFVKTNKKQNKNNNFSFSIREIFIIMIREINYGHVEGNLMPIIP